MPTQRATLIATTAITHRPDMPGQDDSQFSILEIDLGGWGPLIRKAAWALEAKGGHHGDRVEVSGRALREEGGGTEESWPTEDLRVPRIFHKRGLAP